MAEILCLNAGSSSLKFALYAEPGTDEPSLLASGKIENIGLEPHLIARDAKGDVLADRRWTKDVTITHETLLKDLLRAAGLPDAPQLLGEPVRWPLLARGNLDQGPQAAREFVQGYVMARVEEQDQAPASIWLIGLPALRFAGEAEADSYEHELSIDGIGSAWAVPGLELLMDEPERKAPLWRAMCRVRSRWEAS